MPVLCGFVLRLSAAAALSGSRRRRSGFFAHCALCQWRCRAVRLPEAKKRLLRAVSTVPVAVLSGERLVPEDARDRPSPTESSIFASSACQSDYILAESCSTLSHKEKLGLYRNLGKTFPLDAGRDFCISGLKRKRELSERTLQED
ncbi:unnamed protein product [Coccothraustes coccothraustes]